MSALTLVEDNCFHTYRFNIIAEYGCSPKLFKCLEYAHKKIGSILRET